MEDANNDDSDEDEEENGYSDSEIDSDDDMGKIDEKEFALHNKKKLTTFYPFSDLPMEVRYYIWSLVPPKHRTVRIYHRYGYHVPRPSRRIPGLIAKANPFLF